MPLPFELLVSDLAEAIMSKLVVCGITFCVVSAVVGFLLYVVCSIQSIKGTVASVEKKLAKIKVRKGD